MTKLEDAIAFALNAHAGTKRKGKNRAYILHPLEVLTITAGLTENEDILAAAVLHDTVEDTDTAPEEIEKRFGPRVRTLVMAESEDKMPGLSPRDTWKKRKEETLRRLEKADRDMKLICLGDKLANLREMARDFRKSREALWTRFNQTDKNEHGWYYGSVFRILEREFGPIPAILEYRDLLEDVFGSPALS